MARLHSLHSAIPQVPINLRDPEHQYEYKEFPKMMLKPDRTPYRDRSGNAITVNNPDQEEEFRAEHPEALRTFNTHPDALRAEALEDENAKLRDMLAKAGVKLEAEPDPNAIPVNKAAESEGDELDDSLPQPMTTTQAAPVSKKAVRRK